MNTLPHRFREDQFRRYELHIKHIVERWPQPSVFIMKAVGLSSVTFSCRIRDAIRSLREYHWTSVVPDTFNDIVGAIIVSDRGATVVVGPKDRLIGEPVLSGPTPTGQAEDPHRQAPSLKDVESLASLINNGVLQGPMTVEVVEEHNENWMFESWAESAANIYPNVLVTFEPPNIFRII